MEELGAPRDYSAYITAAYAISGFVIAAIAVAVWRRKISLERRLAQAASQTAGESQNG